jgi:DNA-binding IclR family transcriptional regulator
MMPVRRRCCGSGLISHPALTCIKKKSTHVLLDRTRLPIMPRDFAISTTAGVAAVERALNIVAALEASAQPLSLADLARVTGMYKSTLLRLLSTLEGSTLVVRRPDSKYALGQFAFRLGRAFEATYHLKECVPPVLEWLVAQGTESPSFHRWHDEDHRLCLFRLDSHHPTLDRVKAGDILPIKRGAAGKVLRLFRKGAAAAADSPLVHASYGERDPSCAAVACPVFGPSGETIGALSLSGPLGRFSPASVKKMSKPLVAAAERATRSLGGSWPG